jgi:hypothetical protein
VRILVVIPHYFGPKEYDDHTQKYGSNIEPIGRIAALNETIIALHRHFGPNRHTLEGVVIPGDESVPSRCLDIVIVAKRDRHLLAEIGIAPTAYVAEFVDDEAIFLPFHAQRLLKDRFGHYDFYCMMEDDLGIHDPLFFEKLDWFQDQFGPKFLLAPVRFEMSSSGDPAKVITDPLLPELLRLPFRRRGQRKEIAADWHGQSQMFCLPSNPHAASYFLTKEQLSYWIEQPSFDDRDASWVGPLESATTLSVGKVFDIYKPTTPDPFFLEIQHFGIRYAAQNPPHGQRYGEPPLLAIAQNALQAASQVAGLNRALSERDKNLAALDRALADRENRVAALQHALSERDMTIASLGSTVVALRESTSWRITAPLRWTSRLLGWMRYGAGGHLGHN